MEFSQRKPTCFLLSLGWEFSIEVHNMISKEWNAPPPTPQRMCQEIRLLYTKNSCMLWRVICLRIYSSQTASVSALHGWSLYCLRGDVRGRLTEHLQKIDAVMLWKGMLSFTHSWVPRNFFWKEENEKEWGTSYYVLSSGKCWWEFSRRHQTKGSLERTSL